MRWLSKTRTSTLITVTLCLYLVGCETSTKRDCPAFFHPNYEKWAQQGVGETVNFVDQNGVTESFTVTAIERSVPFQTENFGNRESDIPCNLSVRELLVAQNDQETILKLFDHNEFSDRDLAGENFFLNIDFSTSAEEQRLYDFGIDLRQEGNSVVTEIDEQIYYPELEIGGVLYQEVITEEILDERFLVEPAHVSIVAIANGVGLVQYTRVNGSVFSRVP